MCPMIYYENVKARREDLLREAEKERLIKIAQAGQPSFSEKILNKMSKFLSKPKERYQNKAAPGLLKN